MSKSAQPGCPAIGTAAVERRDTVVALAASEQPGSMHVPRNKVSNGTGTKVFVLNVDPPPWCRRQRPMLAPSGLDAGLLIDAEHVIARPQALRANSGTRGKIRGRWREGRSAFWPSQRQSVVPLILATMPLATASWCRSATDQRTSGRPRRDGSSQASALIATRTLGEKAGWAPAVRPIVEPRKPVSVEPLALSRAWVANRAKVARRGQTALISRDGPPPANPSHNARGECLSLGLSTI